MLQVRSVGFRTDSNLISVPTTCMTFGKWLHISKPPFLHYTKGIIIDPNLKNYFEDLMKKLI